MTLRSTLENAGIVVIILVALVATGSLLVLKSRPNYLLDAQAWTLCEQGYRRGTRQDTLITDRQRPIVSRGQATVAVTCGTMRAARSRR